MSTTENPGAVSESNDPLVGTSIAEGRYRIVGIIGEGGMGKVYKGEQKLGDRIRTVAIKTLQPDLAQDNQIVQRFLREAGTVAALEHPNTIKFYESGQLPDGKLFVAMEFIQGESLAHIVARGPLAPQRVEYILGQVCGSLAEAHEQGIVHRDLKPDNVILTQRGAKGDFVKVLDFGIAKRDEAQGEAEAKLTRQGMVLGTPPYMSPEQFTGQPLKPTSDIYSLAMMVYEMLTGKLPYTAATPWEWATKHLTGSPAPFETHPNHAQIPARQKAAVMRALSRDARQRPQSVTEFLNEFTGGTSNAGDWNIASSTSQGQTSGQGQGMPPTAMVPGVQAPMMGGGFQSGQGAPIPGTMAVPMQTGPGGFQPQQPQQGYQSNPGFQSGQGFGSGYTPAPSNAGFNPVQPPPSNPGFNPMQSQPQGFNPAYGSGQGGYNAPPPPANTGSPMKVLAIAAAVVILGGGGLAVALGGRKTNTESNHTSGSQQEAHNGQNTVNPQGTVIQNNPQVPQPQQPWPQQPQPQINNPGIQPIPTPPQPPPNYPPPNTNPDPGVGMQPLPQDPPEQPRPRPIARPRPSCPGSASRIDDLILSGQCRQAQSMFRAMRSAGCAGGAASSFGSACPAP